MKKNLWKNKKNGKEYQILGEAIDCTNERDGLEVFIYQPLENTTTYYVREKKEFFEKFFKIEEEKNSKEVFYMEKIQLVEKELEGSFEIREEGKILAELNFKKVEGNKVDAYHTFVDGSLRGQGIAEKLYEALLNYVKEYSYKIIPTCSYVAKKIQKDQEFLAK